MKKVVIIGGGLAGLTTAYYLSKNPEFNIELYEAKSSLGGRVQSIEIDGFKFNYGAFMIFPWYRSFRRLLKELHCEKLTEHLDMQYEYAWDSEAKSFYEINRRRVFDSFSTKTLLKVLPGLISNKSELYNPRPHRFNRMTVEQYLKNINGNDIKALDTLNKIAVGYTYGSIPQLPMAVYFNFAKELFFNRGFKKVSVMAEGSDRIIKLLEKEIQTRGVTIHTSTVVTIDQNKNAHANGKLLDHDYLVIASAAGQLLSPFLPPTTKPIIYNDHFVAFLRTEERTKVCGKFDWNLLYTASIDDTKPQLTSIGNMEATFSQHPERSLITYLRVPPEMGDNFSIKDAEKEIKKLIDIYLPDSGGVTTLFIHRWENTMPLVSIDTLEALQKIQGVNGTYFVGDYLGAPSMEVAVKSGEEAARLIAHNL